MILLPNVRIEKASPQIILGMTIADHVVAQRIRAVLTVTSCGDGKHSRLDSKHYPDPKTGLVNAFDIRIKDFDGHDLDISAEDLEAAKEVVKLLKDSLGPQFDVVLESNHIHIEYDPK